MKRQPQPPSILPVILVSVFFFWGIRFPSSIAYAERNQFGTEQTFQAYTVRTDFNDETFEGQFEILYHGQRIYQKIDASKFFIGHMYDDVHVNSDLIKMGNDITGDGVPDLVIAEYTGGAHCCLNFYVFTIGQEFRYFGKIEANDGDWSYFADLDGDQCLEFIGYDWTFAYWRTGFASSPAPDIILRFHDGVYILAEDLMRKPVPIPSELDENTRVIQADESWTMKGHPPKTPPASLWQMMLDLIYSGHADAAWQFFDQTWVADIPGKEEFLEDFRAQLMKSPYWREIEHLNRSK
jgi:hypothetical protein